MPTDLDWAQRMIRLLKASQQIRRIKAAWDPETKKRIEDDQLDQGSKIVEHVLVEDFDLVLWQNMEIHINGLPLYYVSLNTGNYDPFDKDVQNARTQMGKFRGQKAMLEEMVATLVGWTQRYQQISIGSSNTQRFQQYLRILSPELQSRGITIRPMLSKKPDLGVFLTTT